jgi:hypothetical protein
VDRQTIEEYLELEKKIASAETYSPALILQQKKDQLVTHYYLAVPHRPCRATWRRGSSNRSIASKRLGSKRRIPPQWSSNALI